MADEACRIDVWLWRARFFKTRALAARAVEAGAIRLTRGGGASRVDKAARAVKVGDDMVFALGQRLICLTVLALGVRRGPPGEARGLFTLDVGDGGWKAAEGVAPLTTRPRA